MAYAAWPASLPAYVLERGYSETLPKQSLESDMEAGRPKSRRRFTSQWKPFQVTIKMTYAQADAFEDFYENVLAGGTLPFTWVHPRTRVPATFKFRQPPPQFSSEGEAVVASFVLDQIA